MSLLETPTITTLPLEVYIELLRYLPAADRRRLRETGTQLRQVLTPEYFRYCVIHNTYPVYDTLPSLNCRLRVPEIPIHVLAKPSNYSWFPGADVYGVYFYSLLGLIRSSGQLKSPIDRRELPNLELVSVLEPEFKKHPYNERGRLPWVFHSQFYQSILASQDGKRPIAFEMPNLLWMAYDGHPLTINWGVKKLQIHSNAEDGKLASSIDLAGVEELALYCDTATEYSGYLEQLPRWPALQKLTLRTRMTKASLSGHRPIQILPYIRELNRLLPTNKLRHIVLDYDPFPILPRELEEENIFYLPGGGPLRESEKVIPQITDMEIDFQTCEILLRYFEFPNLNCLHLSFKYSSIGQARPLGAMVENLTLLDLGDPDMEEKKIMLIVDTLRTCRSLKRLRYAASPANASEYTEGYVDPFLLAVRARYAAAPAVVLTEQELLELLPTPPFFPVYWATSLRNMALDLVQAPERNLEPDYTSEQFFRAASYSEALLRACEEMAGLEYLQICAKCEFYASPALQRLVSQHTTLRQVLLTAEYRPNTRTQDASDRYFGLMYDYLPTVPYRVLAYLRFNVTGYSSEQGPLGTSRVSAVVDVDRRREFHDLTRVSDNPQYEFSQPFDEDVIFNDDFVGWV